MKKYITLPGGCDPPKVSKGLLKIFKRDNKLVVEESDYNKPEFEVNSSSDEFIKSHIIYHTEKEETC